MPEPSSLNTPLPILEQMRDLIYAESGIIFTPVYMKVLDQRVTSICKESGSNPTEILTYLKSDIEYLREFVGHVTTNHTHFFRSMGQYNTFVNVMMPEFIKRNAPFKKINIWSAASSSGEEAYTCAMTVKEFYESNGYYDWSCRILASDIDSSSLREGEKGVYGIGALKHIPEGFRKYVDIKHQMDTQTYDSGTISIVPEIRSWVHFQYHNLMDPAPNQLFDLIFCRNVLIYFDVPTQKEVVRKLLQTLKPGGFFFVSPSETLNGITDELDVKMTPTCIYYIKRV